MKPPPFNKVKRAYKTRRECGEAMLEGLHRKFPGSHFRLKYFPPELCMPIEDRKAYMIEMSDKWRMTQTALRKSVCILWEDGASEPDVFTVSYRYQNHTNEHFCEGLRRVPNIGWDEEGNPVLMGLFERILIDRSYSPEACELVTDDSLNLCGADLTDIENPKFGQQVGEWL